MIKIKRKPPPNDTDMDKKKGQEYQKIEKQIKNKMKKKFNDDLWLKDEVRGFLYKSQHGKCCYCERKRDMKRESDVEHFRPKGSVKENPGHPGYWWLAYEWNNLLISCKTCNQTYKRSKFPLRNKENRVFKKDGNLNTEKPYLINPLKEDPENFIGYQIFEPELEEEKKQLPPVAWAIGKYKTGIKAVRAKRTVDELTGINDGNVHEERAEKLLLYQMLFKMAIEKRIAKAEYQKYRNQFVSPESTFSGFARFYFKSKKVP